MSSTCYISINHPEIFEFHDSIFELDFMDENEIAVNVRGLNISKDSEQNLKGYDLEIKKAHILFHGISDFSYDPGRTWKTDETGNSVPVGPEIIYREKDAFIRIQENLHAGAEIYSHTIVDGDYYEIYGSGNEPFFLIRFKAQEIVVEWNEYLRPAWYEVTRQFKRNLILNTPNEDVITEAHFVIRFDSDELFQVDDAREIDPIEISIGVKYDGKEYWGRGRDCSGQDAFADLQKQLPKSVLLKCCLSCRHGNQSPFSNAFDLLYCMKDIIVTGKMDLCHYTTDTTEINKRSRSYTDICEDWAKQGDDWYVYSDYPLYLKQ